MVGIAEQPAMAPPHAQVDMRSVSACVTAVVTAYADAEKLVGRIKTASQSSSSSPSSMDALEESLRLGPPVVRGQYSQDLKRFGDAFASGDAAARESLKDIVINLQLSLLATLRMALLDDVALDCEALLKASDSSRVEAITCLSQLAERMANPPPTTTTTNGNGIDNNNNDINDNYDINSSSRTNSDDEFISPRTRPVSMSSENPRAGPAAPLQHQPRLDSQATVMSALDLTQPRHDSQATVVSALSPSDAAQQRHDSQATVVSALSARDSAQRRHDSQATVVSALSPSDAAQQRNDSQATVVSALSASDSVHPPRQDSRTTVSALSTRTNSGPRSRSSISPGSMAPNNNYNHQAPRGIDGVISEEPPATGTSTSASTATDLVPHPLWTTTPYRQPSDGYHGVSSVINGGGSGGGSGSGRRDDGYQPLVSGGRDASYRGTLRIESRNFIAELEDPNPVPRSPSQPEVSATNGQQPAGNSVFISADISFLIGPGPDDLFGNFGVQEVEDEDEAVTSEPDTSKPLPPQPRTGRNSPAQQTQPRQQQQQQQQQQQRSHSLRYGVFPPVQGTTTQVTSGDDGTTNLSPSPSPSANANTSTSKNTQKPHAGPSSMFKGVKDRAKRLAHSNNNSQNQYQPQEGGGGGSKGRNTMSPQPGQESSKGRDTMSPQPGQESKGRSLSPQPGQESKGRNTMSPQPEQESKGRNTPQPGQGGGKGRNIQVARALNLSGLKRGLGIHSSSNATPRQSQPLDRTLTTKQMTYVTDLDHSPPVYMPSEENDYSGFCKGSWKLQNQVKRAFILESRPIGVYAQSHKWRCSKCLFEVPVDKAHPASSPANDNDNIDEIDEIDNVDNTDASDNPTPWSNHPARQILAHHQRQQNNSVSSPGPAPASSSSAHSNHSTSSTASASGFDQSVHTHPETGIRYRWIFLAKCHVQSRTVHTNVSGMTGNSFGCIFCCSLVRGAAPVFGNVSSFLEHLTGHAAEEGCTEGSGSGGGVPHGRDRAGRGSGSGSGYGMPAGNMVSYVPGLELLKRTNCIVGRVAGDREEFDVNIPPRISEIT